MTTAMLGGVGFQCGLGGLKSKIGSGDVDCCCFLGVASDDRTLSISFDVRFGGLFERRTQQYRITDVPVRSTSVPPAMAASSGVDNCPV